MPYTASSAPSYVPKSRARRWSAIWNSTYAREKKRGKSDDAAESAAFRVANGVAGPNATKKFAKLLEKSVEEDSRRLSEEILAALEAEWLNVPLEIQPALESAVLSGVGQGALQIEFSSAGMIASANDAAHDYAVDRAAELVGMKRDVEGNLIPNPDAKWAISETTREKIREIIADAFTADTPLKEIEDAIQEALADEAEGNGIFSDARAHLIAQTEISNSQTHGNYWTWQRSGIVKKLKWATSEDERVCPICSLNDGAIAEIGKPFPSGHLMPGQPHPLDRCVLIVTEVGTPDQ